MFDALHRNFRCPQVQRDPNAFVPFGIRAVTRPWIGSPYRSLCAIPRRLKYVTSSEWSPKPTAARNPGRPATIRSGSVYSVALETNKEREDQCFNADVPHGAARPSANHFRSAPNNGHRQAALACRFRAKPGNQRQEFQYVSGGGA